MAKNSNKINVKPVATKTEQEKKSFSPKEWTAAHPANMEIVVRVQSEMIDYMQNYCKGQKIPFISSEWYVGISKDPDKDRTAGHKNRKKLSELVAFKSFYANSLSNARKVEETLCGLMGLSNCAVMGGILQTSKWCYAYHLVASPLK
jgi:hypothetical protein